MFATKLILFICYIQLNNCEIEKIFDLTWDLNPSTVVWPKSSPFTYTKSVENNSTQPFWYASKEFCLAEHLGTHFDAPYHFFRGGWKVAEVPLDHTVAKGALINLENDVEVQKNGTNAVLLVDHLEKWETINGVFQQGTILLVKFGWSQFYNSSKYLGKDGEGALNFPGVSAAAADWIAKSHKFYGVGLDTASVDPGSSKTFDTHRILSSNQLFNLENVRFMEQLPAVNFTIVATPLKLTEGTGSPVRILAIIEKKVCKSNLMKQSRAFFSALVD